MQGSAQVYNDVFVAKRPKGTLFSEKKKKLLYKFTSNSGAF